MNSSSCILSSCDLESLTPPTPFKVDPYGIFGHKDGSLHLEWMHRPKAALLIEKKHDTNARCYVIEIASFLAKVKHFNVYVEEYVFNSLPNFSFINKFVSAKENSIDFILSFGGDGTLLHIASLFQEYCPPILAFAMGSLGFLSPFLAENYETEIDDLIRGYFYVNSRTRLQAQIIRNGTTIEQFQSLNDITITTSVSTTACAINSYIDGEYFTTIFGDGLIVATSTGSTAYSLSAGGAMIHPSVSTILWTPICAHSLNAHPIVLPDCVTLSFKIAPNDRTQKPYNISYDSHKTLLGQNDEIIIRISPFTVPTVCKLSPVSDWLLSISSVLKWNQPMQVAITEDIDESMTSCSCLLKP